jgi:hypothetical protein
MNTPGIKERIAEASPRLNARFAVVFYLLTIMAGGVVFFVHGKLGLLVITACYLGLTALFYDLFKPVSWSLALLTASRILARQTVVRIAEHSPRVHKEVRRTI